MTRDDTIEELVTYLALAEPARGRLPALSMFDEAEPMVEAAALSGTTLDEWWMPHYERPLPTPLVRRIDVTAIGWNTAADGGYHFDRFRECSPRETRGRCRFAPLTLHGRIAWINRDGVYAQHDETYVGLVGGRWRVTDLRPGYGDKSAWETLPAMSLALQWMRERSWRVALGYPGFPSISFTTTAGGILEVFRLRDIPPGKSRRAALRHWVSAHWRSRGEVDDAIKVRKHLRGADQFVWNGLSCRIRVPDERLEAERDDFLRRAKAEENAAPVVPVSDPTPRASPDGENERG
jgi:hypothetical protein